MLLYIIVISFLYIRSEYSEYKMLIKDKDNVWVFRKVEELILKRPKSYEVVSKVRGYYLILDKINYDNKPTSISILYQLAKYTESMKKIKNIYHNWIVKNCTRNEMLNDVKTYLPLNDDQVIQDFVIKEDNSTVNYYTLNEYQDLPSFITTVLRFMDIKINY